MRNYYNICQESKFNPELKVSNSKVMPWVLFSTLLQGYPSSWRPSTMKQLQRAISARSVLLLIDCQRELDKFTTEYDNLTPSQTVVCDRRALAFLKKYPFSKTADIDTQANAIAKWKEAEVQCKQTNLRLKEIADKANSSDPKIEKELPPWVIQARRYIADCLPELTPSLINKICDEGEHGPGATLSNDTKNGRVTPYYKYADFPYTVSKNAARYALNAISRNFRWRQALENSGLRRVIPHPETPLWHREIQIFSDVTVYAEADRITFVPKDIFTDRPIAISASLNMYLQLGVKAIMERALKAVGVDLTDQSKNQKFAFLGSRDCYNSDGTDNLYQFSTVDLASASDTISYEIVRLLLPPEWFAFLCDLRHTCGELNGEIFQYEKFSAMGNGFTFPLESLIFWAVAKATLEINGHPCTERDIAVYGDDIIVRYIGAEAVCANLNWCGFTINKEKSFLSGPFKESCGSDYFKGQKVRPFYLKRRVETYRDIYHIANKLQDICQDQGVYLGYGRVYTQAIAHVPVRHRNYIPLALSGDDSGLSVPLLYMQARGLYPGLHEDEFSDYVEKGYISEQLTPSPGLLFARIVPSLPVSYRGRMNIRVMLALKKRTKPLHRHMQIEDLRHLEAAGSGKITRKGKLDCSTRMVPILDWDGPSKTAISCTRHMIWNVLV